MMKKVSILIPCFNEEKSLPMLYPELAKLMDAHAAYEWELMFVNDGSADRTIDVLKQLRQQDSRVNMWTCRATSARRRRCWRALTM